MINSKKIVKLSTLALMGLSVSTLANSSASFVPGELIVKLKENSAKSMQSTFRANGVELDRKIDLSYESLYIVKFSATKSIQNVQDLLESDSNVEYAEPNFIYEIIKPIIGNNPLSFIPNFEVNTDDELINYTPVDPKFSRLWGLQNDGSTGMAGADIDALKAWSITRGDKAVKIAIIDTGIDYTHPDLVDQMWTNEAELNGKPGIDDDGNGFIDDIHGYDFANNDGDPRDGHSHGTHCAGTIGASHNNLGVAGVMSDVTLVAVKFLSDSGSGSTEGAIRSIDYATRLNVDIMSNSWGGGGRSQALEDAIRRASDKGIIFTAAAGNSSTDNDSRAHYPSNYDVPNVISVAATTANDGLATFSSYGKRTVHIAAPGHNILSTVKGGRYATYSGTSMATPHVTGALGLLIAKEGRMDLAELRERIMQTSEPLAALRGKTITGGRLNAFNLLTNTRPYRNAPKPGKWESVVLRSAWESNHPYDLNAKVTKTFSVPGAKFLRVKVSRFDLENKYDKLVIKDAEGNKVDVVTGVGENYSSEYVTGESLTVTFSSDHSVAKWGFLIEEVEVQY